MSIPCYIPSKDRPAQCDLLLNSLAKNAPGLFKPLVAYRSSNDDFAKGYNILINKWRSKVDFVYEKEDKDSEQIFYHFLECYSDSIIGLFSDDCIFYQPDDIGEIRLRTMFDTYGKDRVFSFTYRLGRNITIRDYVTNSPTKKPEVFYGWGRIRGWDYTEIDFWDMFGFSVGFDSYIYRAKDLLELSERKSFGRICYYEHMICNQFRSKGSTKHFMASPKESCVFVQQINTVHSHGHRSNHTFNMNCEEINKRWLDGYKIDLESIDFSNINCCHGERKFLFKESNNV